MSYKSKKFDPNRKPFPSFIRSSSALEKPFGIANNHIRLNKEFDTDKYIQFKFHDLKSCSIINVCICRQSKELLEDFDSFLSASFGCDVREFRRA